MADSSFAVSGLTLCFTVKDRQATIDWYGKYLGFTHAYSMDDMNWSEMATPIEGVSIGLYSEAEFVPSESIVATWAVESVDATRKKMEDDGVEFLGETNEIAGMVRLATFKDLNGHLAMLSQTLAKEPSA